MAASSGAVQRRRLVLVLRWGGWLPFGLLLLAGCSLLSAPSGRAPCLDGGSACAAAAAPAGMRQVFKGQRMVRSQWVERRNRESGAPDIGLRSQWQPITVRR